MKIFRPLWTKGILLSPQYFQQQTLLNSRDDQGIAQMSVMHPWGVWHAEFDSQVLTQGQLKPLCLNLRFQDGTQIDTEQMDALPPTLTLTGETNEATVLLALPQFYSNEAGRYNQGYQLHGAVCQPGSCNHRLRE